MKVAVVYNRESKKVINLFGVPNREKYGLKAVKRIMDALREGGHQVIAVEGDKDLITRLEQFMPRVIKGERPGMVFNISYGIQGQARYTHVPGILEMVGIPYVGSGPLAHSLSLDKVVAKMIFLQNNLPTPDFFVVDNPDFPSPRLPYPLIVKPRNEAVSMGLRIVHTEAELREAANHILREFQQPVLVEKYIEGPEINVGLLGNGPPDSFPPAEIIFGEGAPPIYTYEDKTHRSGREINVVCPARIDGELAAKAQELARRAFTAIGCYDCARIDMRLDGDGNLYILEINSLPSLGPGGSYVKGASQVDLDFTRLVNRLVEVASARYFGTPHPPELSKKAASPDETVFRYLTQRRDQIEKRLEEWTRLQSRTGDSIGLQAAIGELDSTLSELGMEKAVEFSDEKAVWTWQTKAGLENGILLVGHVDTPVESNAAHLPFRMDPEWLYGEGIGSSRAPLVMMEFALRALRSGRMLRKIPLGIVYYTDEGQDCISSSPVLRKVMGKAAEILILRPGNPGGGIITQRRGQKKYRLVAEGRPQKPGHQQKKPYTLDWIFSRMLDMSSLNSRKERVSISVLDIRTESYPMLVPHKAVLTLLLSYPDQEKVAELERKVMETLKEDDISWRLNELSDRPPMMKRRGTDRLARKIMEVAAKWEIPFEQESSVLPSVAGLAPPSTPVVCGIGPASREIYTSSESVQRISLVQHTLLLAAFLAERIGK